MDNTATFTEIFTKATTEEALEKMKNRSHRSKLDEELQRLVSATTEAVAAVTLDSRDRRDNSANRRCCDGCTCSGRNRSNQQWHGNRRNGGGQGAREFHGRNGDQNRGSWRHGRQDQGYSGSGHGRQDQGPSRSGHGRQDHGNSRSGHGRQDHGQDRRSDRPRGGRNNVNAILRTAPLYLVALALLAFSPVVTAENVTEFVHCSNPRTALYVEPPRLQNCSEGTSEAPLIVRVGLWKPSDAYHTTPAASCSQITTQTCRTSGAPWVSKLVDTNFVSGMEVERCERMRHARRMDAVPLYQEGNGRWTSRIGKTKPSLFESCVNTTNYVLLEGHIAWMDPDLLMSDIGDLSGCGLGYGNCLKPFHTIIWSVAEAGGSCSHEFLGMHNAMIAPDVVIIEELQLSMHFRTEEATTDVACIAPTVWPMSGNLVMTLPDVRHADKIRSFIRTNPDVIYHANVRMMRVDSEEAGAVNLESPVAAALVQEVVEGSSWNSREYREYTRFVALVQKLGSSPVTP